MIYGVGTDLLDVSRIEKAYKKHGVRFAEKLLAKKEMLAFKASKKPVNFLAKRWAVKEAIGKAMGTGIAMPFVFPNIIIDKTEKGQPIVRFDEACQDWLTVRNITTCHISISDEETHILAFAVVEISPFRFRNFPSLVFQLLKSQRY